jgi:hypothetical protein
MVAAYVRRMGWQHEKVGDTVGLRSYFVGGVIHALSLNQSFVCTAMILAQATLGTSSTCSFQSSIWHSFLDRRLSEGSQQVIFDDVVWIAPIN